MTKTYTRLAIVGLLALLLSLFTTVASAATEPTFINGNFRSVWVRQDAIVGTVLRGRGFTWGPGVAGAEKVNIEVYFEAPGGRREVQYFEKARMELTNPNKGEVTAGLIVTELVSGKQQIGDNKFITLKPANVNVAGDPLSVNPNTPTYASFSKVATLGGKDINSKPNAPGVKITASLSQDGFVTGITPPVNLYLAGYDDITGHNIADVFQLFRYQRGPVTDPATGATILNQPIYTDDPVSNVFGLAISEPYWVNTKIGGRDTLVLVQLFQRRVLTYNPSAPADASRTEMGNVGTQYFQWLYPFSKP